MKNYEAEGDFHKYNSRARDMTLQRNQLLGNITWHAEYARTHPESTADVAKMRIMLAEIETLERQIEATLVQVNQSAALAGWSTITRSHLFLPDVKR